MVMHKMGIELHNILFSFISDTLHVTMWLCTFITKLHVCKQLTAYGVTLKQFTCIDYCTISLLSHIAPQFSFVITFCYRILLQLMKLPVKPPVCDI